MCSRARRGASLAGPLVVLALIGTVGGAAYWGWTSLASDEVGPSAILHTVVRDDFVLQVTERGEIKSSNVVEIRSLVVSKNQPGVAILDIVPEGTVVEEGDFLVQLDASALEEQLTTQQIAVNSAEALAVEAKNIRDTARLAKREYLEGTFIQARQLLESAVFVAEENLSRAEATYVHTQRMVAKNYETPLRLSADQFAVAKAKKDLDAARTALKGLDQFTKEKMEMQLEADIVIAEARLLSLENSLALEQSKLADIQQQVNNCHIVAPRGGTVTFAHERDRRGGEDFIVEPGVMVRERQPIIRIPDPTSMQVELMINESLVQFVKVGMPATVKPIVGDRAFRGTVTSVNLYAEPSGWRRGNVKEYRAIVEINEPAPGLREGMTAAATIQCAYVPGVLQVPVQAVYAHGDQFYCMIYKEGGWEARPVVCGPTNDKHFVVHEGLQESEQVAMNPRRFISEVTLPELSPEATQQAVRDRAPVIEGAAAQLNPDEVITRPSSLAPRGRGRGRRGRGGQTAGGSGLGTATEPALRQDGQSVEQNLFPSNPLPESDVIQEAGG